MEETKVTESHVNPITRMDYPDPDVIRVGDTYYMISTTMHFMPGGEILRSYDLVNWEAAAYVYDSLEDTPGHHMEDGMDIYGQGMWAASLRYHKGTFYVCFVANDTHKTYLYQSKNIQGPWRRQYIEGFYHDCSLLFDDDERVYIVYGNTQIYLTELKADLSGPKPGGIHRVIIEDKDDVRLGYEGAHFYKINGKYYVFLIHWHNGGSGRRAQACFVSDSLEGEFTGRDILDDDRNYRNSGVAQGGIVDTPEGVWYAMLFQDSGAVGRIPILVPVDFKDDFPVLGRDGRVPEKICVKSTRPEYTYEPLAAGDDFRYTADAGGRVRLKMAWQWNHRPDDRFWSVTAPPGALTLTTGRISHGLNDAVNTLTQRMQWPWCRCAVTVDGSCMKDGDYAGICALQGCYGFIAVKKKGGKYFLAMQARVSRDLGLEPLPEAGEDTYEYEMECPSDCKVKLCVQADFHTGTDEAFFCYKTGDQWRQLGPIHKLYFKLDHFTGCRVGLFYYATQEAGGTVLFQDFIYENDK